MLHGSGGRALNVLLMHSCVTVRIFFGKDVQCVLLYTFDSHIDKFIPFV